jgi:hypothetical protein
MTKHHVHLCMVHYQVLEQYVTLAWHTATQQAVTAATLHVACLQLQTPHQCVNSNCKMLPNLSSNCNSINQAESPAE